MLRPGIVAKGLALSASRKAASNVHACSPYEITSPYHESQFTSVTICCTCVCTTVCAALQTQIKKLHQFAINYYKIETQNCSEVDLILDPNSRFNESFGNLVAKSYTLCTVETSYHCAFKKTGSRATTTSCTLRHGSVRQPCFKCTSIAYQPPYKLLKYRILSLQHNLMSPPPFHTTRHSLST
jgi:hypothetical protein